ncbi:hypothetical protein NVS55_21375 [Myxococcus stipitatus]|uniref:hypothetical protein n=1 Tax=Myxococcus stipitatus TaxID=83455 RepID=UPI003144D4E0
MADSRTLPEFSLVRGGPFYDLERGLRLVRPPRFMTGRAALLLVLVSWLPLVLFSLLQGDGAVHRLFSELQVHAELLLSLPVMVVAEPYIDARVGEAAREFLRADLVEDKDRGAYEVSVARMARWRDAPSVELALLGLTIAFAVLTTMDVSRSWMVEGGASQRPSLAGGWYLCVSQPLERFLMLRWLWRGAVWSVFLWRASRLPLRLVPTHPDQAGGLGFLAIHQACFSPLVFAAAVPVAAYSFRTNAAAITETPITYVMPQVLFAVLACVAVFAPLTFFGHQMVRAKREADAWFSAVAAHHSRRFEDKWFHVQAPRDEKLLGAPEFSSLADLGSSFLLARKMKLFPWDKRSVIAVGLSGLSPLVILLVLDRQFLAVVNQLRQSVS